MRKTVFIIGLLFIGLVITTSGMSQNNELTREQLRDLTRVSGTLFTISGTNTIGSPYLNDDFYKGYVMINPRTKSETLNLRYNIQTNDVEYMKGEDLYILKGSDISGFVLMGEDRNIEFKNGFITDIDKINSNTIMRSVYDGNVKLLVNYRVSLNEDLSNYGSASKTNKYEVFKNYYLVTNGDIFHEINDPKEDIFRVLSNQRETLESFYEINDLNLDDEKDIRILLNYYDEISRM